MSTTLTWSSDNERIHYIFEIVKNHRENVQDEAFKYYSKTLYAKYHDLFEKSSLQIIHGNKI